MKTCSFCDFRQECRFSFQVKQRHKIAKGILYYDHYETSSFSDNLRINWLAH